MILVLVKERKMGVDSAKKFNKSSREREGKIEKCANDYSIFTT
jgi:hypothetical protein